MTRAICTYSKAKQSKEVFYEGAGYSLYDLYAVIEKLVKRAFHSISFV